MQEVLTYSIVGAAILGSLVFGVVAAQVLVRTAFAVLRVHATSVANNRLAKAPLAS